jgi:hypothetical protein
MVASVADVDKNLFGVSDQMAASGVLRARRATTMSYVVHLARFDVSTAQYAGSTSSSGHTRTRLTERSAYAALRRT